MGAIFDENGNEIGYLNDGSSETLGSIAIFWALVILPVLIWIFMIKLIISGETSADDRLRYILLSATVIATAVIGGKVIFAKKAGTFKSTWIGLLAMSTVVSGIILRLLAMNERGILLAVFGIAFIMSVAPVSVVTCFIHREAAKEIIKTKTEDLKHLIRNVKEMVKSVGTDK